MKFKPTEKAGGLVVELGPEETGLPPVADEERMAALPVFKLRKILVPVDFSQCSAKALAYAIPLAQQFDAELTLLHVLPAQPPIAEMGPIDVIGLEESRKELAALETKVKAELAPERVFHVMRAGAPDTEIIRAAKEMGMDLIVVSTHGRTGLGRVLMGSVAEKVVRHAGCPVLVVREREHEFVTPEAGIEAAKKL